MTTKKEHILENDTNLEFPHIYAIDASAGAGKTTYLTERFLQFLFSGRIKTKFRNLAAITFTNKAANEMKTRVIGSLKKIAFGSREEISKILPLVTIDERSIIQKSEEIIEDILLHYTDLHIGTIDSFINSIIRASAIESGVSPDFEITMQPESLVEYAVDIMLEKLEDSSLRKIFDDFLRSYLVIEERGGWYPKRELLNRINLLRKKENEKGITFSLNQMTNIDMDQIIESMKNFLRQCKKFELPLVAKASEAINKFIEFKKTDSKYLMYDDAVKLFPKNSAIPDEVKKLWVNIKKNLAEYYKNKAVGIFHPYLKLQETVQKNLENIKYEKGMVFIDELNACVKNLIEKYQVPYIYYKLGEQITHYSIDEFQDTNEIQWKNIKNLVLNSLSEGGSLFYVGDKKQAIYRFRGGSSELFDEVISDNELTAITRKVYSKTISANRRSKKEIIDFNNRLFSIDNLSKFALILKDKTYMDIFNKMLQKTYSNVRQEVPRDLEKDRGRGFVFIKSFRKSISSFLTGEEIDDIIKEQLLKDISNVLARRKNSDIAILVRKMLEVKTVTGWLLEKRIETVSETAGDLREQPLIREIISFLKFLKDPLDNLAFAGFICGDIFTSASQIKIDEIYNWLNKLNVKKTILYKKFREWNNNEWNNYIDYFFKNAGFLPVYDIIIHFFDRFRVFLTFKESGGFLIYFLETIRKMEEKGKNNIEQIIQEWDKKNNDEIFTVPLNVKSGAVNVMTIHKAKGLEFSCVFMPFAGVSCETKNEILLNETNEIAFTNKEIRNLCNEISSTYSIEKAKSLIDEINIFYVGCTRAKDELYIYAPPKIGRANNMLMNIPPFSEHDELEIGERLKPDTADKNKISKKTGFEFFSTPVKSDWVKGFYGLLSREELIDSLLLKDNQAIKIGNLIHRILSTIITFDESKLNQEIEILNEPEELKKKIEEMVKKMISSELLKRYFFPDKGTRVYCEVEVTNAQGDTKRIDRLVINNGTVTLLDFKTGSSENISSDKKQIKEYINLIKKIYPGKTTTGLIVYIDPFKVIEV